jgi:hypothetical protein
MPANCPVATDAMTQFAQMVASARANRARREIVKSNAAIGATNTNDGEASANSPATRIDSDAVPVYPTGE